jgi:hypothetical protein
MKEELTLRNRLVDETPTLRDLMRLTRQAMASVKQLEMIAKIFADKEGVGGTVGGSHWANAHVSLECALDRIKLAVFNDENRDEAISVAQDIARDYAAEQE